MSAGSGALVSLDLHKKFSRAVVMGPGGGILDDRRVCHADPAEMEAFFDTARHKSAPVSRESGLHGSSR